MPELPAVMVLCRDTAVAAARRARNGTSFSYFRVWAHTQALGVCCRDCRVRTRCDGPVTYTLRHSDTGSEDTREVSSE